MSRKVTQDKRVVMDTLHMLNIRIAKNNLAYPLLKDTFSVLGSSRCGSPIGVRSKRMFFIHLDSQKILTDIVGILTILQQHII